MINDIERIESLNTRLNAIPHLNLSKYLPHAPLREMIKELFQFTENDFYPYITGFQDEKSKEHMANNWKGMCLIDSTVSGRHNIDYWCTENNYDQLEFKISENGDPIYSPTDVGSLCPKTIDYLYSICERPNKTRLSRIVSNGGSASWHSHKVLSDSGDEKFVKRGIVKYILHIPLITNYQCFMGVSETNSNLDLTAKKYWQRYNSGEVWIFNNYWYHNAVNLGTDHRDHIMMYVERDDEKLIPIIEKAVNEYQGPLITGDLL
jgi:hypothetical protein